eukprot:GGOE01001334.1.p2 GENE.GGOE01001334.1~~GGOE01001334.1.p2  ORF type:complete len:326 (-),score=101.22 GGOE01001334.1:374-1351(-)
MDCPPFSLDKPRFDADTFLGRALHFYNVTDMRTLFCSRQELERCQKLLDAFREKGALPDGTTDADLWYARKVKESMVHPDTGEVIFPLWRFSAFAPVNVGIVGLMLLPSTVLSPYRTVAVHWLNQTYNAATNYANRNASNPISNRLLAEAYAGAVGASVSIALGATFILKRLPQSGAVALTVRTALPFLAVALAGGTNVALIRRNELVTGVNVSDKEGNVYGKSVIAGQYGLLKCAMARILWNIPIMVFPPVLMSILSPRLHTTRARNLAQVGIVTACLQGFMSPSLAVFPQRDQIPVVRLEERFRNLRDPHGRPVSELYYNKGL